MFEGPSTQLVFLDGPHVGPNRFPRLPGVALEGPKNVPSEPQERPEREKYYKTSLKINICSNPLSVLEGLRGSWRDFGPSFLPPLVHGGPKTPPKTPSTNQPGGPQGAQEPQQGSRGAQEGPRSSKTGLRGLILESFWLIFWCLFAVVWPPRSIKNRSYYLCVRLVFLLPLPLFLAACCSCYPGSQKCRVGGCPRFYNYGRQEAWL